MKRFTAIIILLAITNSSLGSKILFMFPTPSKSHMIITHALSTALAEKGHEVTVVSSFPLNEEIKNHREIYLPIGDGTKEVMERMIKEGSKNMLKMIFESTTLYYEMANDLMTSNALEEIKKEKFDLLVVGMMLSNFLLGFSEVFNCPAIMLSVQRHMSYTNILVGNPMSPNASPHFYISKHEMNFLDRVKNFALSGCDLLMIEYFNYHQRKIYDQYFPSTKYRSFDDATKNISLVLVNDHFTEGVARANVPAMIEIRGLHIKPVADKLPHDLQKFLDEATEGAIYLSLGRNVKPDFVSNETLRIFMSTFSKLPQRVIMKWDNAEIDGKSENVIIKKWLPQSDILAHPNVKLFISHCGLGGIVESQYRGVPILGLPMFGDQSMNANLAVEQGWVVEMDIKTLSEADFYEKIQMMIQNDTYSNIVKGFSRLYNDRPLSARDTAVYWTEYVINHRGAKHLQYAAVHQNFWQRNSLDVIGFLLLCLYVIVKFLKFTFKIIKKITIRVFRTIFGGKRNVNKNKKNL